ncbi:MAG: PHP domain-containing protein [candidate division WOR-3 bacterium]|nr:MAG: PHP domain-containing protein [candidate division WOR-3 bacterium]
MDLHIHSCLSPCADLMMSPKRIVQAAIAKKLDMIAVCDHNSAENVEATMTVARNTRLTVLPGMEVTSSEEVHVCGIFRDADATLTLQELVYSQLSPGENNAALFGDQIIVNEFDEVEEYNRRLLIGATNLSVERVVAEIHRLGGLAIACHVDRQAYSIIEQLGFVPKNLQLDALEISAATTFDQAVKRIPQLTEYPIVSSSDAHSLDEIGKIATSFKIENPDFDELRQALRRENGRSISLRG